MKLIINGQEEATANHLSIMDLLKAKEIANPTTVAVELNNRIVRRKDYEATKLSESDRVELLYFMGGGTQKKSSLNRIGV